MYLTNGYRKLLIFRKFFFRSVFFVKTEPTRTMTRSKLRFRSDDPKSAEPPVRDLYLGVYGALGGLSAITIMVSSLLVAVGGLNASRLPFVNFN